MRTLSRTRPAPGPAGVPGDYRPSRVGRHAPRSVAAALLVGSAAVLTGVVQAGAIVTAAPVPLR